MFRESYGAIIFKTKKGMIAHPLHVGAAGFEPATSWSQTRRDDRTTLRPELVLFQFDFLTIQEKCSF